MGDVISLLKPLVTFMNAVAAMAGYAAVSHGLSRGMLSAGFFVWVLAMGASSMNCYQDMETDALFTRTRNRPLPKGRLTPEIAVTLSLALISTGLTGLFSISGGYVLPILGISGVVLYNGLYTPAKKRTLWAMVPGALSGVVPPLMGAVCAGASMTDHRAWMLMTVLFLWQFPHFWLVTLMSPHEYFFKSENKACLPSLLNVFSIPAMHRVLFMWICAYAMSAIGLTLPGMINGFFFRILLYAVCLALMAAAARELFIAGKKDYQRLFIYVNVSLVALFLLIFADAL